MSDTITKHDSALVVYNSNDAIAVDSVYGNGRFTCNINNANFITHCVKVFPSKLAIPNVFENIKERIEVRSIIVDPEMNNTIFSSEGDSIMPGFYTLSRLLETLNSIFPNGILKFAFNNLTSLVEVQILSDGVVMPNVLADLLGFCQQPDSFDASFKTFLRPLGESNKVMASCVPCVGTTPVVHVVAKQIASNNMVASNSRGYNVVATVNVDVPYGSYIKYNAPDIFVDDIDYRTHRDATQIEFELLDCNYNVLKIDKRFPVILTFKLFHMDTNKQ